MKLPVKVWIGGKRSNVDKLLKHPIVRDNKAFERDIEFLWNKRGTKLNSLHLHEGDYVTFGINDYNWFRKWTGSCGYQKELKLFYKKKKLDSERLPK